MDYLMQDDVCVRQKIMMSLAQTAATGGSFFQGWLFLLGMFAKPAHPRTTGDVVSEVVLPHNLHHSSPLRFLDKYFGSQHREKLICQATHKTEISSNVVAEMCTPTYNTAHTCVYYHTTLRNSSKYVTRETTPSDFIKFKQ